MNLLPAYLQHITSCILKKTGEPTLSKQSPAGLFDPRHHFSPN